MPIYEYLCSNCNQQFEMMQKITEAPLEKCIHCSGSVKKLVSRSSFHLKGTGWYVTDYANKSGNNGSRESSVTSKTTETKTESASSTESSSSTSDSGSSSSSTSDS